VAFHPSGDCFAIGTNSKSLVVCKYPRLGGENNISSAAADKSAEILVNRTRHHKGSVYCCAFSPAGNLLATGSNDKLYERKKN
jgi:WD40 repeat protein